MIIRISSLTLALVSAFALNASGQVWFSDNFNIQDTPDFNSMREVRQSGLASPAFYRVVTAMAPGDKTSRDRFKIENKALAITSSESNKRPASLCLDHDFNQLGWRYRVAVTVRPINGCAAVLWTPFRRGEWPDNSAGLSLNIESNGAWTAWNNCNEPKQIIGSGQVTQAEKFQIALEVDEDNGRRVTISINGAPVIEKKSFSYSSEKHYAILQTNGQAEFDDLVVEPAK